MSETCGRCNVEMTLGPREEGSLLWGWYCPCCRRIKVTADVAEENGRRLAESQGIPFEEFRARRRRAVENNVSASKRALTPEAERGLHQRVAELFASWEPTCEHDTKPPGPRQ